MRPTLVLDRGYQPVNIVPFSRAMAYVAKAKVDILKEYDQMIHPDFLAPAVVRLTNHTLKHRQRIKFSRQNVLIRDKLRCQYCGKTAFNKALTYDHVIPRSKGGTSCWENIVMACVECNREKADKTPQQAGMRLLSKPSRPSWNPLYNAKLFTVKAVPSEWRDYWTVELEE